MARGKFGGSYGPSRRGKKGGDDGADRWLGTYGDAITLLMAFFVMLYAMAEVDITKFTAFVSGLEGPFGNTAAAQLHDALPALVGEAGAEQPVEAPPGAETAPAAPDLDQLLAEAEEQKVDDLAAILEAVRLEIDASLVEADRADIAEFTIEQRGLIVSIASDDVLFETGSTVLSDEGRRIIRAVAQPLRAAAVTVMVEGHTDNVPLARDGYTNWNLSTDRAVAVVTMMSTEVGVSSDKLGAAGYGEFRPRASNSDARGRGQNRRVDIVIAPTTPAAPKG
jgi:chemotaxis protein MotB